MEPRGDPLLDGLQRPGLEPEDGGVQYSTVQYSIEYSVVQSTLQYSAVQYLRMAESISASLVTRAGWTQALYTVLEPRVEEDTRYSTSRILPSE